MRRFSVSKRFANNVAVTGRVSAAARMFGVDAGRLDEHRNTHSCEIEVEDGDIVYITGPSGAGKSVLLREIEKAIAADERINIEEIELPADRAVIDCVDEASPAAREAYLESRTALHASRNTTFEAMRLLGYAGLSDVFCILTAPANLSEGQKYRYRLACALACGKANVFADEFCSNLDRITAAVIAYNVRKFARRNNITFFLASSHEDILADLQPDVLVVKRFTGEAEVTYKTVAGRS
jgi:ABC-type ATPase with predicted acetyltransferase domain